MPATVELIAGEKAKGESKKAIIACNDYLAMGPRRSLRSLEAHYRERAQKLAPTQSVGTLTNWSRHYGWQGRAEAYDATIEAEKDARRQEIMQSGLSLDYERVVKLKALADFLEEQMQYEPPMATGVSLSIEELEEETRFEQGDPAAHRPYVWLKDYKQIGGGDNAEKVVIVRFNTPLISEYRAALDDIAKEVGGRKQKVEHSGDKENPLQHAISYIREVRPPVIDNGEDE